MSVPMLNASDYTLKAKKHREGLGGGRHLLWSRRVQKAAGGRHLYELTWKVKENEMQ